MENAVDALKIGAAILIFMIAIACSFSLFGTAKRTSDSIITMRDKQAYLKAAEEDVDGILYTSSSSIIGDDEDANITTEYVAGITKNGDRVVKIDDVISTIYRYSIEKYGVTVIDTTNSNTVIARFDANTENFINSWNNIKATKDEDGNTINAEEIKKEYIDEIKYRLNNSYVSSSEINLDLDELFKIGTNKVGAPWGRYEEIYDRIGIELFGGEYKKNGITYDGYNGSSRNNRYYEGKDHNRGYK